MFHIDTLHGLHSFYVIAIARPTSMLNSHTRSVFVIGKFFASIHTIPLRWLWYVTASLAHEYIAIEYHEEQIIIEPQNRALAMTVLGQMKVFFLSIWLLTNSRKPKWFIHRSVLNWNCGICIGVSFFRHTPFDVSSPSSWCGRRKYQERRTKRGEQ